MTTMLFVPFRNGCILVHVLNDIPPADPCIVSTEANLALLCAVRNNAHLRAAEVVIKQILKPHTSDKQEVPTVGAPLFDVLRAAVTPDLSVVLPGQSK